MESANKPRDVLTVSVVFIATALLVWFGAGLTPWWPLMWIAPLPLFWYSLKSRWWSAAAVAAGAWLIGSTNLLGYFHTLGLSFGTWLVNYGSLALMVAAGVCAFRYLVLRGAVWTGIAALPALWVSIDWLRNWVTPHGTAADLAYTQLRFLPFLQLASLTGPWGMSFLLLVVPAAIAAIIHLRGREPRRALQVAAIVGALLLAVLGFGVLRLNDAGRRETVQVGLIVSDMSANATLTSGTEAERLFSAYAAQARELAARGAQVVVLPEKIAVVRDADEPRVDAIFQALADGSGITVVAGELHISPVQKGVLRYNRAQIYAPRTAVANYDKEHMLPPFESNLTPGTAKQILRRGDTNWGVAICKDMDFTSMSLAYGRSDAALLLVPGWDFNLDRTWHGHMAIMRGVEGGFAVARSAKNAYLTVSDDRGRILAQVRSDSAPFATLLTSVPVGHEATLFQMWGDWFAWVAVGCLVVVIARLLMAPRYIAE